MAKRKKERAKSAESVKIADLKFSEEFLKAENLAADGTVAKDQVEALKKKYADFQAQSSSEGASGDTTKKKTSEGNATGTEGASKPVGEEVRLVSNDIQVDNENTWIDRYEAILKGYAEANNQEWKREAKDEEGKAVDGLKGSIGEAKFHFTDENKAIVNAEGINAIVALAKETGQEIAYNEAWSDEFKNKMLKACEAQGVTIQGRPEAQTEQTNESPVPAQEQTSALEHVPGQGVFTLNEVVARVQLKRALQADKTELEKALKDLKDKGAVLGNPDSNSAKLALFEYALAMREDEKEKMQDLGNALKKYGIESVKRNPDQADGQIEITSKDYSTYSAEEKAKIDESVQKLQPKGRASENGGNSGIDAAAIARNKVSVNG